MRAASQLQALLAVAWVAVASADPPSLDEARQQLGRGEVDELYVAFSAVKKGAHPAGDAAIAQLLVEAGRVALQKRDPSLALGLADKARKLHPANPQAGVVACDALLELGQPGAAEEALDAAIKVAPNDWPIVLRRAEFAEKEGEIEQALKLYRRIPAAAPESTRARDRTAALDAELGSRKAALEETRRNELEVRRRQQEGAGSPPDGRASRPRDDAAATPGDDDAPPREATPRDATTSKERVQGLSARSSTNFRIVYSTSGRDFAQAAGYEQRVLDLFERARGLARKVHGEVVPGVMDVVLYTREEFAREFGAGASARIAGLYSAGKIRMNLSETIDDRFLSTAVHEYTHGVVDALHGPQGFCAVWLNEGFAEWTERKAMGQPFIQGHELRAWSEAFRTGGVPRLSEYDTEGIMTLGDRAGLAYAKGSVAVEVLVRQVGGPSGIVGVLREQRSGVRFPVAFARRFGDRRADTLDAEVDALVKQQY